VRNLIKRPIFWIAVVIAVAVAVGMSACEDPAPRPLPVPVTCATWQDRDGNWREPGDGELVDEDPCDLDDLFEVRTTAPAKPVPKASPAKPAPRTTRR